MNAQPVTLSASEVAFLAARLRRLFADFEIPVPGGDDDARLIGNAGAAIGLLLGKRPKEHHPDFSGLASCPGSTIGGVKTPVPANWRELLGEPPPAQRHDNACLGKP